MQSVDRREGKGGRTRISGDHMKHVALNGQEGEGGERESEELVIEKRGRIFRQKSCHGKSMSEYWVVKKKVKIDRKRNVKK